MRFVLVSLAAGLALAALPPTSGVEWVHSANVSAAVDALTGAIVWLNTSVWVRGRPAGVSWPAAGAFSAGQPGSPPVPLSTAVTRCADAPAAVCMDAVWRVLGETSDARGTQTYVVNVSTRVSPATGLPGPVPTALAWRAVVTSAAPAPWRTTLAHTLDWAGLAGGRAGDGEALFWAARQGNEAASKAGVWEDVLRMLGPADAPRENMQYGLNFLCQAGDAACTGEILAVPALAAASAAAGGGGGAGIGVMAALDDDIFILRANVSALGGALWRQANRLGGGQPVSATTFLVPLAGADWRPLFAWGRAAFPRFFLPPTLLAGTPAADFALTRATPRDIARHAAAATRRDAATAARAPVLPAALAAGLGLYTCASAADVNISELRASGATHIWDAHFNWPYIGMPLPPIVPAGGSWLSNTGSGEEGDCGPSFAHGQATSVAQIAAEARAAAALGLTVLQYFNLFEFGENITSCALPPPSANRTNDWRVASQFLADVMPDSTLPGCPGTGWQDGIVLDPAAASFADFLVAQAAAHVAQLGDAFAGFAVDRLDHTETWVHSAQHDDGLAWCGDACHPLLTAFIATLRRVSDVVYGGAPGSGRIVTVNYVHPARIDAIQHADGVFSEDYENHIRLLVGAGLSTTGKPPVMIWVYTPAEVLAYAPTADAYFGQHLLVKAFPFAPVLGADHSVAPAGAELQALYTAWGPLFGALRGACWWLAPTPVAVEQASPSSAPPLVNAFTLGGGCTDPSADGGNGPVAAVLAVAFQTAGASAPSDSVTLSLTDTYDGAAPAACAYITPGDEAWTLVPPPTRMPASGRWELAPLPMRRGVVLLRCVAMAEAAAA